jgi:hypothetical protein
MPYVTKTRKVKRSWFERLFSLSWFTAYKEEEYQHWVQPEPLPVRTTAGYPKPAITVTKPQRAKPQMLAPVSQGIPPETTSTYTRRVDDGTGTDLLTLWAAAALLNSSSTSPEPAPAPFVSGQGGEFGGGGASASWAPSPAHEPAPAPWSDYKVYDSPSPAPSPSYESSFSNDSGGSSDFGSSSSSD